MFLGIRHPACSHIIFWALSLRTERFGRRTGVGWALPFHGMFIQPGSTNPADTADGRLRFRPGVDTQPVLVGSASWRCPSCWQVVCRRQGM